MKETGNMDKETKASMKLPRCGRPDLKRKRYIQANSSFVQVYLSRLEINASLNIKPGVGELAANGRRMSSPIQWCGIQGN